jgi:flagellar motor switch protein FliN/FliY
MNSTADIPANLDVVLDIPVELSVQLGTCSLPMRQVLQLEPGSIVQLDKTADAPVDVFVNHKLVARGEVVVLEDRLGIRITQLIGRQP